MRSRRPSSHPLGARWRNGCSIASRRARQPEATAAAILVVQRDGGYAGLSDTLVDLRVDDHERPIEELRRLYGLHDAIFGKTPRDQWVSVDDTLASELLERLAKLGYEGELGDALFSWAGTENLEERLDGAEQLDPVLLEALRSQSG